jgi:hypothetical protein
MDTDKIKRKRVWNMITNNHSGDNSSIKNKFVEELINENIDLMTENIKLICENKWLSERMEAIESFYRVFGADYFIGEDEESFIMIVEKGKQGNRH